MATITEVSEKVEDVKTGFQAVVWMEFKDSKLDTIDLQITINGHGVAWSVVNHSLVRIMDDGNTSDRYKMLQAFLKPEYFNEIDNIINSNRWKSQKQ